jgi:hypothetical protein
MWNFFKYTAHLETYRHIDEPTEIDRYDFEKNDTKYF